MTKQRPKVLLIGWDAADWNILQPLIDAGKMPALKGLIDRGVSGRIATLDPPYSPMLWTTVATGKTPDEHGILNFTEPAPKDGGIRPVLSTSRNSRALWNIFTHLGLKSNLVGWWPTHPAEPINGVIVSDLFQKATKDLAKGWPVRQGMVHPQTLQQQLAALRVHPEELTPAHILPFIPLAEKIDQKNDKRLHNFVNITAQCATIQSTSTWLMQHTEWDFTAIYLDGIDHYCHGFIRQHPPKLPEVPQEMFDIYKGVVDGGYVFHDMMLERILALIDDNTTVIVMSDHGFYSDHLRLRRMPEFNAAPAMEHRPYGIFCAAGPGIAKGQRITGASLLDVAPTILAHMQIPVGKDMPGKVLQEMFEQPLQTQYIDSWENVEGDFGEHSEAAKQDPVAAHEAMQQLVALGYVEAPGDDKTASAERAKKDIRFNTAMVHKGKGEKAKAIALLEALQKDDPKELRYSLELVSLWLNDGQADKAKPVLDYLKNHSESKFINLPLLESKYYLSKNKPFQALQALEDAQKQKQLSPNLYLELGRIYIIMHRFKAAEEAYKSALERDKDSAHAYRGLAVALLRQGKAEEAAQMALNAIDLLYYFPAAHYILGEALQKCGFDVQAAEAYEVCLRMDPGQLRARRAAAKLYNGPLQQPQRAVQYQAILDQHSKGNITVLAGLPGAGSDAVAEKLAAKGANIKDTFEETEETPATGSINHVQAGTLKRLSGEHTYKVVLVERDMKALLRAYQTSIGQDPDTYPIGVAEKLEREMKRIDVWEEEMPNVEVYRIDYDDFAANTDTYLDMIFTFFD